MDNLNTEQSFSRLDLAFAHFLSDRTALAATKKNSLESLLATVSLQLSLGHNCILLAAAEKQLILDSGLLDEQAMTALKLEHNRLYLHRYWFYENRLAEQIKLLMRNTKPAKVDTALINRYFIELIDEIDWQREAAINVLKQSFSIITGGPGTGKTTTVVKILALLQEQAASQQHSLHIALAAPTGKAAMRLQESIGFSKKSLPCSELIKQGIPETVCTIHRLLGAKPPSPYFLHDANHPLVYDVIVIDEASMVDLALMSKLVDALKPAARLVLLGDKDQLASVESGAVLADLSKALTRHTVELKKSHRFQGEIRDLATAVNSQAFDKAWEILNNEGQQVSLLKDNLIDYIVSRYSPYLLKVTNCEEFTDIFAEFSQFQVLCSNRSGENGVIELNRQVETAIQRQNKIHISGQWYIGRPIMITQNNAAMQLYNGDIGLCLFDQQQQKLAVYFLRSDGNIKKVLPSRIPAHETVFAMTIHKSQGSEFDECLCVLPEKMNPVLSKELIYTAITRAKSKLKIASSYAVFSQAVKQKVQRSGGLIGKLAGEGI